MNGEKGALSQMKIKLLSGILLSITFIGSCTMSSSNNPSTRQYSNNENPFYYESNLYMKFPPFDKIKNEHYMPAFEKGIKEHMAEIEAIANNAENPTFNNTIIAMETSGELLDRVSTVFFSLTSAHTNDDMEKIRSEMAPKLSAHSDQILLNGPLFKRISQLNDQKQKLGLEEESIRLIEKYYIDFVRSGA